MVVSCGHGLIDASPPGSVARMLVDALAPVRAAPDVATIIHRLVEMRYPRITAWGPRAIARPAPEDLGERLARIEAILDQSAPGK